MTKPNLFSYATSELSQDAFIAWLLAWADPACREADGPLHRAGVALLDRLLALAGVTRPAEYRSVRVERQWNKIDVLAVVNDEVVVPVEDKTHTKNHSGQLDRYLVQVRKRFPPPRYTVAPIYVKTGDQCSYDEVRKAGWFCFLRRDILGVLHDGRERLGVRNDIFDDFLAHLQGIEDAVRAFRERPLAAWDRACWVGFYTALQDHLPGAWWKLVKPPRALPFMGLGWHWHAGKFRDNDVARFLHLEEKRLCFKLEVKPKDRALRAGAWREWSDAVLGVAPAAGLEVVPGKFRPGTWMTVALSKGYRQTDERGLLDLERTVETLRKAERVQDAALARLSAHQTPAPT